MSGENHHDQNPTTGAAAPRLGRAFARLMGESPPASAAPAVEPAAKSSGAAPDKPAGQPGEHGGPKGPEPTRYGDWERKGRCIDF